MNHWRSIHRDQMRMLAQFDLSDVVANHLPIERIKEYEVPTLQLLYEWARNQSYNTPVLYLHTKGANNPGDQIKLRWRLAMEKYLIHNWQDNVKMMLRREADMIGVNFEDSNQFPHYNGNFWIARCGWIAHLDSPIAFRDSYPVKEIIGWPWERMCAEMWICSKPGYHEISLLTRNEDWWSTSEHITKHEVR